jgi:hypothetical protein
MYTCKKCNSAHVVKNGKSYDGDRIYQKIKCKDCGRESYCKLENGQESHVQTNIKIMKQGISEQELRAKHDVSFKIKKTAESLSGDIFYTEYEFIKLCEIQQASGWRHIIDSGLFDSYKGKAGGTVYWSNPQNIERLKNEGILK